MNKAGTRILILLIAIVFGGITMAMLVTTWPAIIALYILWVFGFLAWIVKWHAKAYVYQCSNCKNYFTISAWIDALSPHMVDTKLLRCPHCDHSDWFKAFERDSVKTPIIQGMSHITPVKKSPRSLYYQIAVIILLYAALWIYTLSALAKLPIQIHVLKNGLMVLHNKSILFTLPAIASVFPFLQVVILGFAIKQGYKSRVYTILTVLFMLILLLMLGLQIFIISKA
jgi:DNA-directed RNA polymerase subunit RPC12/RpoP